MRPRRACGCTSSLREQILDAADDELRLERLREHAVAPGRGGARLIHGLERAGQEDDRNVRELRVLTNVIGDFVAVFSRHADVGEDDVGRRGFEPLDGLIAVADREDLDVLVGKCQLDDALNRDAIVGQQQSMRHLVSIGRCGFRLQRFRLCNIQRLTLQTWFARSR